MSDRTQGRSSASCDAPHHATPRHTTPHRTALHCAAPGAAHDTPPDGERRAPNPPDKTPPPTQSHAAGRTRL
ncbi:hypothetical protein DP43_4270 [Burkholderia pseudomallei]|nr:hypothetical protein DP43_4270 [Burkholderia pseudomallei]